ncbi:sulfatase-like hydrolase/transferase [Janibacter sp. GS2]|uniref:sulfatase-like hydrolase/transferase n=1 Tax=Janibacter sp. GS2 TaxID=3442646 RepID=UPI003EBE5945
MGQVRARAGSVLACALIWFALVLPSSLSAMSPGAFVRIPLVGLVITGVLLVLPARARRAAVPLLGVGLAVVVVIKTLDIGFSAVLDRRFRALDDLAGLGRGFELVEDGSGRAWAVGVVVLLVLVTALVVLLLVRAVARVAQVVTDHRDASVATLVVAVLVWVPGALVGVQVAGGDVASNATSDLVRDHVVGGFADHRDAEVFAEAIADDPPAGRTQLLSGLRGKDVLLVFVESYGRAAVTDPELAKGVTPVLEAGTGELAEAGFEARSAYLTSPTVGAGSWLAHSTLQSGLWVDSDRRYEQLLPTERTTLTSAFEDAGWRTSFVLPAVEEGWPEGRSFYGFDRMLGARDLDYRGPSLGWGDVPDQYTLSWFWRSVLAGEGAPVMAQIDLVSSHHPWPQPPPLVPTEEVGDGSVHACMPGCAAGGPDDVRSRYAASIGYSLQSLVSLVAAQPDPDLVVVLVGDHQPWSEVTGTDPSHDVPVTIIAPDTGVLDRVDGWGWTPGMTPRPDSPVWRMDAFRDRFFAAFSGSAP